MCRVFTPGLLFSVEIKAGEAPDILTNMSISNIKVTVDSHILTIISSINKSARE